MAEAKRPDAGEPAPKPDIVHARPTRRVDPEKVEVGDIMCTYDYGDICDYGKVTEVGPGGNSLRLDNLGKYGEPLDEDAREFSVVGRPRIEGMASADYHDKTAKPVAVTRTEMARILASTEGTPFTVAYVKKDGQERMLRGHFVNRGEFGRSLCRDLELPPDSKNLRLVDHETLVSLIVGGVKFVLKSR